MHMCANIKKHAINDFILTRRQKSQVIVSHVQLAQSFFIWGFENILPLLWTCFFLLTLTDAINNQIWAHSNNLYLSPSLFSYLSPSLTLQHIIENFSALFLSFCSSSILYFYFHFKSHFFFHYLCILPLTFSLSLSLSFSLSLSHSLSLSPHLLFILSVSFFNSMFWRVEQKSCAKVI